MNASTLSAAELDFSMNDPSIVPTARLLPILDRLRETAPVFWSETSRCWHVTGYEAVAAAFQDIRFSNQRLSSFAFRSIPEGERAATIPELTHFVPTWLVNVDGAHHQRLRSIAVRALNKKFVDSLIPWMQGNVGELAAKAARLGQCDFMAEIAYYLPATIILKLLGLPLEYLEKVREWSKAITSALVAPFSPPERLIACDRAMAEMNAAVRTEIEKRLNAPQDDLLTKLVTLADESNKALTQDEVLGFCHILLTAGHDTTVNSMVLGLNAFIEHPDQAKLLLERAVDPLVAMQEMSRFIGMSSSQARVAGEDFEFYGKRISKGDVVFLWILSANYDPARFPEPRKFDLLRANVGDTMTFGPGLHHCIGHYLARVELATFFPLFLPRFSRIEVLDRPLAWSHTLAFRTVTHLNTRFVT